MSVYYYTYVGLLLLVTGLFFLRRQINCARYGYQTTGEVVKMTHNPNGGLSFYPYPVIRFTDRHNKPVELIMMNFLAVSTGPMYAGGERIEIYYYKNSIYPAGRGWLVLYSVLVLAGLAVVWFGFV